MMWHRPFKQ
jgi:hypothetical protein